MAVTYQAIEENELKQLFQFAAPIWRECYRGIIPAGQIELLVHKYFDYDNILRFQNEGMVYEYVLFDGERAGFAAYQVQDSFVYLDKLYLLKSFRGKHIASQVFDDYIARYQKPLRLNVNKGNTLGLRAYKGRGFQVIETKRYDLPGGYVNEDYIMEKTQK